MLKVIKMLKSLCPTAAHCPAVFSAAVPVPHHRRACPALPLRLTSIACLFSIATLYRSDYAITITLVQTPRLPCRCALLFCCSLCPAVASPAIIAAIAMRSRACPIVACRLTAAPVLYRHALPLRKTSLLLCRYFCSTAVPTLLSLRILSVVVSVLSPLRLS